MRPQYSYAPQPQQRMVMPPRAPVQQYYPQQPVNYQPPRLPYNAQPQYRPAPNIPVNNSFTRPVQQTIPPRPVYPQNYAPSQSFAPQVQQQPRVPFQSQSYVMASPVRGSLPQVPYQQQPIPSPVQQFTHQMQPMQQSYTKTINPPPAKEPTKQNIQPQPMYHSQEYFEPQKPERNPQDQNQKPQKQTSQYQQPQQQEQEQELEDLALQYEDGFIYRGQGIAPTTRHGFGILSDQYDNEVYSGFWKDNNYHGEGRLNNLDKADLSDPLDWKDLNNIDNYWSNYDGGFNEGKMHGKGKLTLTNGESYEGEFRDGTIEGPGKYQNLYGEVIEGEWDDGKYVE